LALGWPATASICTSSSAVLTYLDRATADVRYYTDEWLIVYRTALPSLDR